MDKLKGWGDGIKYHYADDVEANSEKKRIERIYDVAKTMFTHQRYMTADDAITHATNFVDTFTQKFGEVW